MAKHDPWRDKNGKMVLALTLLETRSGQRTFSCRFLSKDDGAFLVGIGETQTQAVHEFAVRLESNFQDIIKFCRFMVFGTDHREAGIEKPEF